MKFSLFLSLIAIAALFTQNSYAQVYMTNNGTIRFFSEAPLENIESTSKSVQAALHTGTGKLFFRVPVRTFKFEKALMEEHFNENYLESDKYPNAEFDGAFTSVPDLKKDGTYNVMAKGKLTVHGVSVDRTFDGTVTVKGNTIKLHSVFNIKCEDHKIAIPKLVFKNIAEELEVTVDVELVPKK